MLHWHLGRWFKTCRTLMTRGIAFPALRNAHGGPGLLLPGDVHRAACKLSRQRVGNGCPGEFGKAGNEGGHFLVLACVDLVHCAG